MVSLPDQSGETFRHIVSSSVIDEEKYNQLLQSSGIFVFINPSKTERDALIPDIPEAIRNETDEQIEIVSEFRLNIQAEYIKILQYLYYIKKDNINLKIIVSAWDMYPEYKTPEQVIRDKVPLIWQFLYTNSELYKCEYWGLSAQGGDLDDPEVYKKLEDYENQSERIIVVDSKGNKSNDITNILI